MLLCVCVNNVPSDVCVCSEVSRAKEDLLDTDARIAAVLAEGVRDISKYHDNVPHWMQYLVQRLYAHEHPAVVAAAGVSDQAAYHYISATTGTGLPDIDGIEGLVRRVVGSKWVEKNRSAIEMARLCFPHLTLPALRGLKGVFGSWSDEVELLWLQEVISRLAPPSHIDLTSAPDALSAYCEEVWAVLDSTSMAAHTANSMRVCVAYHRVKIAYATSHSWSSKPVQDAMLAFFRVPMRGTSWELTDVKGFFGSLSADWWLRHAASSRTLAGDLGLALPPVPREEMDRVITDAMLAILGAERRGKPGAHLSPWSKYCSEPWLKAMQAKAQILSGK